MLIAAAALAVLGLFLGVVLSMAGAFLIGGNRSAGR